jgi:hypothetical protein
MGKTTIGVASRFMIQALHNDPDKRRNSLAAALAYDF